MVFLAYNRSMNMNTVKIRVYIAGVLVGEEEVSGPLAVHKPAPAVKKQGRGGK